jgi:AraC family transcriptional regulator, regulatory protein of adaptative response / methylated-DNA-[protein]-cysteine methyltransferase
MPQRAGRIVGARVGKGVSAKEMKWMSLVRRDVRADGSFYYGVKTTGVFCRPSCPSRLPRRSNVLFFASVPEAHAAGFRPCRRCRPEMVVRAEPHLDRIVLVCGLIATAEKPPTLGELAEAVGLCPSHLHRVFKNAVGVTPKGYAAALRAQRLKDGLRPGVTVTQALFDAGFGSVSRLYADVGDHLGMSPARYRSGGEGILIRYAVARTDLGWVLVAGTERGVCAIDLGDSREALIHAFKARFDRAEHREGDPESVRWLRRVTESIVSPRRGLDLPLDIRGTAFQRRVWQELRRIPAGKTASYGEVARRIGKPGSARAVARACASNPLALAVPCHRVVRSDGNPGGYRWGVERKRALLEREGG